MESFSSDEGRTPRTDGRGTDAEHTGAGIEGAAFGDFLRQAREKRQLTVAQIASNTKISPRHLTELEKGNVGALPHGMYRRAMLRAYAESVGLDKAAALQQFERTFEQPQTEPAVQEEAPAAVPVAAPVTPRRPAIMLIAVAAAATVVVALITEDPGGAAREAVAVEQSEGPLSAAPRPSVPRRAEPAPTVVTASAETAPAEAISTEADRRDDGRAVPAAAERLVSGEPLSAPTSTPAARVRDDAPLIALSGRGDAPAARAEAQPRRPAASAGQLAVHSEPAGARVTVNGMGWGVTPATVPYLPFGDKRVRLTLDGYASQEHVVTLSPDRPNATVRVTLSAND